MGEANLLKSNKHPSNNNPQSSRLGIFVISSVVERSALPLATIGTQEISLCLDKHRLSAVVLGTDGEVQPIAPLLVSFDEELIVIALGTIRDIE